MRKIQSLVLKLTWGKCSRESRKKKFLSTDGSFGLTNVLLRGTKSKESNKCFKSNKQLWWQRNKLSQLLHSQVAVVVLWAVSRICSPVQTLLSNKNHRRKESVLNLKFLIKEKALRYHLTKSKKWLKRQSMLESEESILSSRYPLFKCLMKILVRWWCLQCLLKQTITTGLLPLFTLECLIN